ncbi:hypothetical protein V8C86DRAFT_2476642 [Haematococcus lacustris]
MAPWERGSQAAALAHGALRAAAVGELLEQQAGPLNIAAVPAAAAEALQEVMTGKGYLVQYNEPCTRFERQGGVPEAAVQRAWSKAQQLKVPMREKQQESRPAKAAQQGPGCTAEEAVRIQLDSLRQEDAALVNQHWTYSSAGSLGLVQQMIASYPSSCIRLPAATLTLQPCADLAARSLRGTPASTSLVSSQRKNQVHDAQVSPAAAQRQRPCMAHCLPAFRRHGLMSLCMADLVDKVLQAGQLQDCVLATWWMAMLRQRP